MAQTFAPRTDHIDVLVVDARPQDYLDLAAGSGAAGCGIRGVRFQFATNGTDALKLWRTAARSVWLVNIHLPDGSGCDLAAAIRARDPHSVVYLVGDQYDPGEELKARMAGGSMYVCKPAEPNWLALAHEPRHWPQCA